jgi:hypothetical protein
MRIKKLQTGGIAPYSVYSPAPIAAASTPGAAEMEAATPTAEGASGELLDEKMIKLLMENGIPSDVDNFLEEVNQLQKMIARGGPIDSTSIMYRKILPKINRIKYDNDRLNEVTNQLVSNGGLTEVAMTDTGLIFVSDEEGNIKPVTVSEYKENRDNLRVISNNEIKSIRSQSPSAAFNNNYISVMANGKGLPAVTEELLKVINTMKENKESKDSFIPGSSLAALEAFADIEKMSNEQQAQLYNALGMDNDVMLKKTTEYSTNVKNYKNAINYILTTLPKNSLTLLNTKAAQTDQTVSQIVLDLIMTGEKSSQDIKWEIKENQIEKAKNDSKNSSGETNLTFQNALVNDSFSDHGLSDITFRFSPKHQFKTAGAIIPGNVLVDTDGKPLPANASLSTVMSESLSSIASNDNVFLGDKKINFSDLDRVMTTGNNQAKVYMPLDQEAMMRGEIKPDLEIAQRFEELDKERRNNHIKKGSAEEKALFDKYNMSEYWNVDPTDPRAAGIFAPFVALNVIAQGDDLVSDMNKYFMEKVEESDELVNQFNIAYHKGKTGKEYDKGYKSSFFKFWEDDEFYRGTAFIAITNDKTGASFAGKSNNLSIPKYVKDANRVRQMEADQIHERINKEINNNNKTSLLDE